MKQVLQTRTGLTVVREVPAPPCAPGSVLVRNEFSVISAGTEGSRVALAQKSLLGKARERPDLVRTVVDRARREGFRSTRSAVQRQLNQESAAGYSSAGRVVEIGASVSGFQPGDRVACAGGGRANHAELVSVPSNLCANVPDEVSMEAAALTTIAAIALHGIRLAEVSLGDRVAVIGCGLVGQITCRLLAAAGAEVFALDLDPARVEAARAAGADHAVEAGAEAAARVAAATQGVGVDAALVTAASNSNAPLVLGAEMARDRGALVVVGDVPTELPRPLLFGKELSLRVSRSYGPGRYDREYEERGLDYPIGYVRWTEKRNMECVLGLQARGHLDLAGVIEEILPVDAAAEAYERLTGSSEARPRGAMVLAYPEAASNGRASSGPVAPGAAPRATDAPRVGLVGPGGFASRVIVPALQAAGARLEVVGGGSGPSAEAATRQLGFARTATGEDAVISDPDIDAVIVATRHASHARLSAAALRAGKHIFCEKPLALSVEELADVLKAAGESRRVLGVGFNRRFAPLVRDAREFFGGSARLTATYRVSAGRLPADHWVHDLAVGGGRAIGEVGHFVDTLVFLTGARVIEVHASGHGAPQAPVQARDNLAVSLAFEEGSVASILYVSDGSPRLPKERLEGFSGSRTIVLEDYRRLELLDDRGGESRRTRTQDKGHRAEIAAFVDGVRRGAHPVPLAEVENVSLATIAIVESLRTGAPVRVSAAES